MIAVVSHVMLNSLESGIRKLSNSAIGAYFYRASTQCGFQSGMMGGECKDVH